MKAPSSDTPAPATPVNPGKLLRNAREAQGLTLTGVALQLNLPCRFLEQIETGNFASLPGNTFARGYVRTYAKLLGMDQSQLVQEFDRFTGTNAKGSQVHSLGRIEEPVRFSSIGLRLVSLLLLLVLCGLLFFWWQESNMGLRVSQVIAPPAHVEVEGADGTVQIHPLDDEDKGDKAANADKNTLPLALPKGSAATVANAVAAGFSTGTSPASASLPTTTAAANATTTPAPTEPAPASEPPLPSGHGRLEMQFTANCWTRVIDGDGRVLLNALMKAGTSHTLQGKEPLNVRFGYGKGAQLTYNGKVLDLAPHTKGSVARLQLGQ